MLNPRKLYVYRLLTALMPETSCFGLKRKLLSWAGAQVGKDVRICSSANILGAGELSIGEGTWIGQRVLIVASGKISIGRNVDIAMLSYIGNGTHKLDFEGERCAGEGISLDIVIGSGCWLGVRSTILPGVELGKSSMVAAGAVVTKSFPSKVLLAGVPAVIKHS